jgi:hypothetical protein
MKTNTNNMKKQTLASKYLDEIGVKYTWTTEEGKDIVVVDVEDVTPEQRNTLVSIYAI